MIQFLKLKENRKNNGQLVTTIENSRMEKNRDLFKKIGNNKGTFHAKMGTLKDRNDMYLTDVEDVKMKWQEYTELFKKDFNDPDNLMM